MIDAGPGDRVLLLGLLPLPEIQDLAARLSDGIVVGLVESDDAYNARQALRDFANIMIMPAGPGDPIPWRDGFFSVVYAPMLDEPTPEVLRVVAPGGTVYLTGGPVTRR